MGFVIHVFLTKKDQIKEEIKQRIKDIQKSPTAQNALLFNALVLGVHNYFRYATHINLDLNRMNYVLSFTTYNRLSNCSTRCYPNKASPTYKKFYSTTMKTYKVAGVYLYPLCDVSTKTIYGFNTEDTPFTRLSSKIGAQKPTVSCVPRIKKIDGIENTE